ncbi:hypothetical protein [Wielerella bovis]|uniref:hypothetical protein n=1 Tax=Wielerella bovis TaxID=2917790 RepID=UPI002019A1E9|nr:hypothetical protein [Wielerella bovis]MCG7656172.1 hypothetical protein [Wielerella bovis]MCG7658397.1 hypothetical protein [Wielerella bovis]
MNNSFKSSSLALIIALALTACNNQSAGESSKTAAVSEPQSVPLQSASSASSPQTNAMPADIEKLLIKSPYMDFQVNASRVAVIAAIKSEFQVSPEQNACLLGLESNPSYLSVLEPYFKGILSESEIQEADAFFASDAGRKFNEMMLKQIGAENLPPFVEPSADEKKEIAAALLKPFFIKVKAKTDAMSEQEAMEFTAPIIKKEVERCKIA